MRKAISLNMILLLVGLSFGSLANAERPVLDGMRIIGYTDQDEKDVKKTALKFLTKLKLKDAHVVSVRSPRYDDKAVRNLYYGLRVSGIEDIEDKVYEVNVEVPLREKLHHLKLAVTLKNAFVPYSVSFADSSGLPTSDNGLSDRKVLQRLRQLAREILNDEPKIRTYWHSNDPVATGSRYESNGELYDLYTMKFESKSRKLELKAREINGEVVVTGITGDLELILDTKSKFPSLSASSNNLIKSMTGEHPQQISDSKFPANRKPQESAYEWLKRVGALDATFTRENYGFTGSDRQFEVYQKEFKLTGDLSAFKFKTDSKLEVVRHSRNGIPEVTEVLTVEPNGQLVLSETHSYGDNFLNDRLFGSKAFVNKETLKQISLHRANSCRAIFARSGNLQ